MADHQLDGMATSRRAVRAALTAAALALLLVVVMLAAMARLDGQAKAMRDDLDGGRLRQYGVDSR